MNNFAIDIEISTGAQKLFSVGGFPITNSMVTGIVSFLIMMGIFVYVVMMLKKGRYNRFVGLVQWTFEGMLAQVESVFPDKKTARKVAPLALSIFFYMLISYWMSVLPGLDSIKYNHVSILRSIAADLNFTFAVAIVVLIFVQYQALRTHGPIGNAKRYLRNPFKDPIGAFEGVLEFIGEFSRYAALSVRMFGNCFAGEILLVIITILTSYVSVALLPLFIGFELFIGFVQAYVFFILTVIFTSLALESHGSHDSPEHSPAPSKQLAQQE